MNTLHFYLICISCLYYTAQRKLTQPLFAPYIPIVKTRGFTALFGNDLDTQKAAEYSAAMLLVAGQVTIVVNAYGGGNPFIFTVGRSGNAKKRFMEQFEAYLNRAGNYFWLENTPFESSRSWKPQPLEISLREFAVILLENSDMPMEIRFEKPEKEAHDPYSHEQFTFVFTDVAEAIVGVCNSDSRVMPFCGDVSNDACIGSFVSNFVNYLTSCGFRKNVRVFGNGFNHD